MRVAFEPLKTTTADIFEAAGCSRTEADRIGHLLVESNLAGHDSHGVIRIPFYIEWLKAGDVLANQSLKIIQETDILAVVDGQYGFGQSIGTEAVQLGIDKAQHAGVSVIALRNSGHLGRIGDWPLMAAQARLISLHYVNTSGKGLLVAPFGGIERRLSANPIAAGVPLEGCDPIVLDMSACTIAEGKIKVAYNKGVDVPEGCLIDAEGNPTNDPKIFYGDPPGSILPVGGHKGYGLGLIAEVMAGALTGSGCTNPDHQPGRLINGMLSIYIKPEALAAEDQFYGELKRYTEYVKSSRTVTPDGEILLPGEIEMKNRTERTQLGIELDETTRNQIAATGRELGVDVKFAEVAS